MVLAAAMLGQAPVGWVVATPVQQSDQEVDFITHEHEALTRLTNHPSDA
jgi:hypothetical protein